MTLIEHLAELRRRCWSSRGLRRGRHGGLLCSTTILSFLQHPYCQVNAAPLQPLCDKPARRALAPGEDRRLRRHLPGLTGDPVGAVALHHPGLNPKEKKYAIPFIVSSIFLFCLGLPRRLRDLSPRPAVPGPHRRPQPAADLQPEQLLEPHPLAHDRVRSHIRIPVLLISLEIAGVLTPQTLG